MTIGVVRGGADLKFMLSQPVAAFSFPAPVLYRPPPSLLCSTNQFHAIHPKFVDLSFQGKVVMSTGTSPGGRRKPRSRSRGENGRSKLGSRERNGGVSGPLSLSSSDAGPGRGGGAWGWMRSDGLWNLPNILSMMRVLMVPMLAAAVYAPLASRNLIAAAIFAVAGITDFIDGYLARRWSISSPFGAFIDPVADKLIVATALILLTMANGVRPLDVGLPTALTISREIAVSALREWMAQQGKRDAVKVGFVGKCKTAAQMVAITGLLLALPGGVWQLEWLYMPSIAVLWASSILAVQSGVSYFIAAWPSLNPSQESS